MNTPFENSCPPAGGNHPRRERPQNRKRWSGCGTALITPFLEDGRIDFDAWRRLLHRQTEAGIHFLVPLGTTGETPCLEDTEKLHLLETAREEAAGRPLLVGAGTNSTAGTVRNLARLPEADGYLIVTPYYNKPTQQGLLAHFRAVAESTDKDLILYNVPGRTGVNLSAETTLRLAEIPNIAGIKEASGNYAQISEILRNAPAGFSVLSGNDDETLSLMGTGADGVISVASNIDPARMAALTEALLRGDFAAARELHFRLAPLFRNCFVESNPIPAKAGMAALGLIRNILRLPLTPATESTCQLMEQTVRDLGLL